MTSSTSLRGAVTPPIRLLLTGMLLGSIGSGLTLSLLIVYLSSVRGLPTVVAGLVLSWVAVLGLVFSPVAGMLIDRVGPRRVMIAALVLEGVGVGLYALVHTAPQAFGVATVVAVGGSAIWPAQSAIIAELTEPDARQRVFGIQFMVLNLGLGIGGLIAASIVDIASPDTFVRLYLIDAVTYFVYAVVVLMVRLPATRPEPPADDEGVGGYREVLADRRLRRVAVAGFVLVTFGYGSMDGLPVFMVQVAGLPVRDIGIVFAVNTGVIVIAQWFTLKVIHGRSRSLILALVGVLWAASWAVMGGSALLAGAVALLALCAGMALFALAETLWSPIFPALLNHLAPAHLRGRYNAIGSWSWNVGGAIGPAVAGALIGAGAGGVWIALVVGGSLAGAVLALTLKGLLTPAEDGRTLSGPVVGGSTA